MTTIENISLGTVKLGISDYGFSSAISDHDLNKLEFLKQVSDLGITKFDTSPRYGDSEKILGDFFSNFKKPLFVSSKIDELSANSKDTPKQMLESVKKSLQNLKVDQLDICYLHQNELTIISDPYVHEGLQKLKDRKLIKKTGASVYSLEEGDYAIESGKFDVLQIPVNVFDLQFYHKLVIQNVNKIDFVARSILLQGILVNRSSIRNSIKQSQEILSYLKQLDLIAEQSGLSTIEMALAFVFSLQGIDHYIIGSTSTSNLQNDIRCLDNRLHPEMKTRIHELADQPKDWSNPRNW